jgi:hypothetical protein
MPVMTLSTFPTFLTFLIRLRWMRANQKTLPEIGP